MEIEQLKDKNCSAELKSVFEFITTVILEEHPSVAITTPYFIVAMLNSRNCKAFSILKNTASSTSLSSIENYFIREISLKEMLSLRPNASFKLSKDFSVVLDDAEKIRKTLGEESITSTLLFLSILKNDKNIEYVFSSTIGMGYKEFLAKSQINLPQNSDSSTIGAPLQSTMMLDSGPIQIPIHFDPSEMKQILFPMEPPKETSRQGGSLILAYCADMNREAEEGKYDRLIGRKSELAQIYRVLGRRNKNNVLILGDGGVGKTAIIKGLVQEIVNGNAPESIQSKHFYSLDVTALIAGTSMRGMLEERLKKLIKEFKKNKNNILFIDDINMIMSSGKSDVDMSAVFNQALSENEIQIIGTTTYKNYHSAIETNNSFDRKFQKLNISPATIEETIEIISSTKDYYEKYHNVKYPADVVEEIVKLSDKYISERLLPDSAIDILDEVGSSIRVGMIEPKIIGDLTAMIKALEAEKQSAIEDDDLERLREINKEINDYTSELLDAKEKYHQSQNTKEITLDDVHHIISEKTGIPVSKLSSDEKKSLTNINEKIKKIVVGQDEAVDSICRAIKRNRVGLGTPNKPVTFLELGKTGIGKTLLAKTIAKEVFGDEKYLIRFDMSEYADKTAVNKLIGAGAGYVGYENGGLLTEAIKKNKYAVLLCDEIEKADPEIYNIFLQIMDEGRVTDNFGKKIDCKNLILIFTSNVGAREAQENSKSFGFIDDDIQEKTKAILDRELKSKFTPEFLNRIDEIIYFNSLTEDNLRSIIRIELEKTKKKISDAGYGLSYDNGVVEYFLKRIEPEKEFGARPIIRVIQEDIVNPVTDIILESSDKNIEINLTTENGNLIIQ